jgi:O-antigen/teichoic acid export membrane protein
MKRLSWQGAGGVLMLYAGKASGVLVTLLFIPLYNRVLGPEQFGAAAVILSLQALLLMLDFGLATLVGRDVASGHGSRIEQWVRIRDAERVLLGFYVVILLAVLAAQPAGLFAHVSPVTLVCSVLLFGFLVLQNLHYCVILASREYTRASLVQLVGNLARAGATALVLCTYSASLEAFVTVQALCALLQAVGTRAQAAALLGHTAGETCAQGSSGSWQGALRLLRRSAPLALFAAAGAAVMQLDKPIISAYMSSASVGPYFLAMTLCMVPTSVLAGPVTQYFQPKVLEGMAKNDPALAGQTLDRFTYTLLAVTLLPCCVIWLLRGPLIGLWLGNHPQKLLVAHYVEVLLPGVMVGALGYIPYTLLLAIQDYRFQGLLSCALTILTLVGAAFAAHAQSATGVAIVYALYHVGSTVLSWGRSIYLDSTRAFGLRSWRTAFALLLVVALGTFTAAPHVNSLHFI